MSKTTVADIEIRHTSIANQSNAYRFHLQNLNSHLLPRTRERFKAMINDREVYEAFDHVSEEIVGICYIARDTEICGSPERVEFGGVFVNTEYRGSDLPYALASFAICKFSLDNPPISERLVAHVHQYNRAPLKLIRRLGFKALGAEIPPPDIVKDMEKNQRGYVIGLLFVFMKHAFSDMGTYFEALEKADFSFKLQNGDLAKVKFDLYEETEWTKFSNSVKDLSKASNYMLVHRCLPCITRSAIAYLKTYCT